MNQTGNGGVTTPQSLYNQKVNHPLFSDGNIPKNKDMNGFTKDISGEGEF